MDNLSGLVCRLWPDYFPIIWKRVSLANGFFVVITDKLAHLSRSAELELVWSGCIKKKQGVIFLRIFADLIFGSSTALILPVCDHQPTSCKLAAEVGIKIQ